jgi:hypothetical protein
VKTDFRERGKSVMHRIDLAQDRKHYKAPVITVTNLQVPQNLGKF